MVFIVGNLSDHFNHKDFACQCPDCRGEYKIHLGLVGALELIGEHFRKKVRVVSAYWCESFHEKHKQTKKSSHLKGKAAHIKIDGVTTQELYKFAETIPELRGMIFYPNADFIHVDTREGEPQRFVKEGSEYVLLTPDKRARYGLS